MEKETRQGFCRFCNEGILVEVWEDATQAEADRKATEECTCMGACIERKREQQRTKCSENIREILGDHHPEVADLFLNNIENIQNGIMSKITVNIRGNKTARMSEVKDGIKVELEKKQKEENLA